MDQEGSPPKSKIMKKKVQKMKKWDQKAIESIIRRDIEGREST